MPPYRISREVTAIDHIHFKSVTGDFGCEVIAKHPHMIMLPECRPPLMVCRERGVLSGDAKGILVWHCKDRHSAVVENTMNLGEAIDQVRRAENTALQSEDADPLKGMRQL